MSKDLSIGSELYRPIVNIVHRSLVELRRDHKDPLYVLFPRRWDYEGYKGARIFGLPVLFADIEIPVVKPHEPWMSRVSDAYLHEWLMQHWATPEFADDREMWRRG